ncbi:MAG TPA: prohibitin family protein [Candidatus Cryosericum sp.]|nr:prohibitin family protein [Candidatus Cryosericum sp.]
MFRDKAGNLSVGKIVSMVVVALLVLIVLGGSIVVVQTGESGVVLTFGRASEVVMDQGIHLKIPFVQKIVTINNRIVKTEVTTEAFSKDLQTISSIIAVNYHINKSSSATIYTEVGLGYEDVLITPAINEVLKAVTAQYTAQQLVGNRVDVSIQLDESLNAKLNEYGIFIDDLNIINWDFSEEYIVAIEAKQVAEQNLIKTRTEQEQALVIANTEAQKQVIAAQAEADKIKLLAEANAESNNIITASLNDMLIRYETIQKWDGALPKVTNGTGSLISIDLPQ